MEWISVEDRMPEESTDKILLYGSPTCGACSPRKTIVQGRYSSTYEDRTDLRFAFGEYDCSIDVTHWMPMPEPPKENEHGVD